MTDAIPDSDTAMSPLEVIENCIMVINECREMNEDVYDTMQEDKVKVMANAFKLIAKIQRKLITEI